MRIQRTLLPLAGTNEFDQRGRKRNRMQLGA